MITKPDEPGQNTFNDKLDAITNQTTDNPKKKR